MLRKGSAYLFLNEGKKLEEEKNVGMEGIFAPLLKRSAWQGRPSDPNFSLTPLFFSRKRQGKGVKMAKRGKAAVVAGCQKAKERHLKSHLFSVRVLGCQRGRGGIALRSQRTAPSRKRRGIGNMTKIPRYFFLFISSGHESPWPLFLCLMRGNLTLEEGGLFSTNPPGHNRRFPAHKKIRDQKGPDHDFLLKLYPFLQKQLNLLFLRFFQEKILLRPSHIHTRLIYALFTCSLSPPLFS